MKGPVDISFFKAEFRPFRFANRNKAFFFIPFATAIPFGGLPSILPINTPLLEQTSSLLFTKIIENGFKKGRKLKWKGKERRNRCMKNGVAATPGTCVKRVLYLFGHCWPRHQRKRTSLNRSWASMSSMLAQKKWLAKQTIFLQTRTQSSNLMTIFFYLPSFVKRQEW